VNRMVMTSDLVDPNFKNLQELVDSCVAFYEDNVEKMGLDSVRKRRADLSFFVERFHRDCGTFTPEVQKRLEDLRGGDCMVVMSAHQPNLFAYSGVMRKATLIFVLAKELEKQLKVPVVNFFGVADQDFTDDRWVKSSLLPAVLRRDGLLSIHIKLPEKVLLNSVSKPSRGLLDEWKGQIESWLDDAVGSVERLGRLCGLSTLNPHRDILQGNFGSFWRIVEDSHKRSKSYSDFNAFVMSKIVNEVWGYDTLFSRFSECQQAFTDEIAFLLSRNKDYSRLLEEAHGLLSEKGVSSGVSAEESQLIPFWYHCDCGSKVRLFSARRDGSLFGYGDCEGCGRHHELDFGTVDKPDVSGVASRISLRAISWILAFSKGLGFSCYVGGVGGVWYLMEVRYVADRLGIVLPPTPVWRPRDRYVGIGQLEALLKLKEMCANLGVSDLSEAVDILKSRIVGAQVCLDNLEDSKRSVMEKLQEHLGDEELEEEVKRISLSQTEVKRSSNLSVIYRKLKILENVPVVLALIPSIIDYAVNVGLKETSDQWVQYLNENGCLSSDVHLEPILNRFMRLDISLFTDNSLMREDK
jgi:hypothetical protein